MQTVSRISEFAHRKNRKATQYTTGNNSFTKPIILLQMNVKRIGSYLIHKKKKREAEQVCASTNGLFAFNVRHIKEFGKGVIRQDTQRAEGTGSVLPLCTLEIIIISVAAQRFWASTNEIELNTLLFGE